MAARTQGGMAVSDIGSLGGQEQLAAALQGIADRQREAALVHPLFARAYPVIIVTAGEWAVFDRGSPEEPYRLSVSAPPAFSLPADVAAAFPLEVCGGRAACVVGTQGLGSGEWSVKVLHEFVHCYQFQTCEMDIKEKLSIHRPDDPSWELTYPFPYAQPAFTRLFGQYLATLGAPAAAAPGQRQELMAALSRQDAEYMAWQEWKEGVARLVENELRRRWHLPENHAGRHPPYSRVSFYESGAAYLCQLNPAGLPPDLGSLFSSLL